MLTLAVLALSVPVQAQSPWILTWHDEFDGTSLNPAFWNLDPGSVDDGSYGGELQAWQPQNVVVQGGLLSLLSKREHVDADDPPGGFDFTSGVVTTKNKVTFADEWRLEVRARLPRGRGLWPAIWTREGQMPIPDVGVELDIMENLGHQSTVVYHVQHVWNEGGPVPHVETILCTTSTPATNYAEGFHTFGIEVSDGEIRWFVDGVERCSSDTSLPVEPSHLLLSTGVGGDWPGPPDGTTPFPQSFDIDYVRLYTKDIEPAPGPNLVTNGDFSSGTTNWIPFATPDSNYIVSNVTNGVFEFYRAAPPPGTANEAEILQHTGAPLAAFAPVEAMFDLGNSDIVPKRVKVLLHDLDFADSASCSFLLEANAPLRRYRMRAHSTRAWTDTSLSIYAATVGSNGGFYRVDNVSLQSMPAGATDRTECLDPTAPVPPAGAAGGDLLVNGNFDTDSLTPWQLDGPIVQQISSGVLEFRRGAGTPSPVVLQATGQAMTSDELLTATLQLGNSSTVRKRVKVLVHDLDFSDAPSCAFWLPAGQTLGTYTMRVFASKPWTNAAVSVYPSTPGEDQWTLMDNVTLQRTPGIATVGTDCIEPAGVAGGRVAPADRRHAAPSRAPARSSTIDGAEAEWPAPESAPDAPGSSAVEFQRWPSAMWTETEAGWVVVASTTASAVLRLAQPIDLGSATTATLGFQSWLSTIGSRAEVQISLNGVDWVTVSLVPASGTWVPIDIDLRSFLGERIEVQFVFHGVRPPDGDGPDVWRVDDLQVNE